MSAGIEVNEFKHIPGKNDAEYIKLLKEHNENWERIATDAVVKIIKLSAQLKEQSEIIHCKDCKFYGRADKRRFYRGSDCLNKRIDTIVPDRDFCSRAEKKGGEE